MNPDARTTQRAKITTATRGHRLIIMFLNVPQPGRLAANVQCMRFLRGTVKTHTDTPYYSVNATFSSFPSSNTHYINSFSLTFSELKEPLGAFWMPGVSSMNRPPEQAPGPRGRPSPKCSPRFTATLCALFRGVAPREKHLPNTFQLVSFLPRLLNVSRAATLAQSQLGDLRTEGSPAQTPLADPAGHPLPWASREATSGHQDKHGL